MIFVRGSPSMGHEGPQVGAIAEVVGLFVGVERISI
jgi:hypothetical protein